MWKNASRFRSNGVLRILADVAPRIAAMIVPVTAVISLIFFPWASDTPLSAVQQAELQRYYAAAYSKQALNSPPGPDENSEYVRLARDAARTFSIAGRVAQFARTFGLADKRVLDIGAGRGYLQDVVEDYTGLDISPSAKRFFHKRFVLGSATAMPFADSEFDGAWSIWVLEHVPNPEAALAEMRRVVKDQGVIYLLPAWDCTPWVAGGYPVRSYGDLGWRGKLLKAFIPLHDYFWGLSKEPVRLLRRAAWKAGGGPTRLRYRLLEPNYEQYWMLDSDAVNSLDRDETAIWFRSRGDECLNCGGRFEGLAEFSEALVIRVRKGGSVRASN